VRPYPEEVLRAIQTGVTTHLMPEVQSSYAKAQFAFSMLLFTIAQRDLDTAVPDLLETNAALRKLLGDTSAALRAIDSNEARTGIEAIAGLPTPTESLRLSHLRADNDALRAVLSSLAALIEPAADDSELAPLRGVRTAIFAHLSADARRRIVPILTV